MAIDYDLFLKKLIKYVKENENMSILNLNKNFNKNGIWANVYFSMYGTGTNDNLKIMELYSAWKNNNHGIKKKLMDSLNGKQFFKIRN